MSPSRRVLSSAWLCLLVICSGCVSGGFSIRSLPAETPAADNAAAIVQARGLQAQSQGLADATPDIPQRAADQASILGPPLTAAEVPSLATYDPWERMNRATYRFNARFDEAVFFPVANRYRRLPAPVRGGVHHFFANLGEVVSVVNYAAQLRLGAGARSLGRFVINSTLGLGGLFDVATSMHLRAAPTGFSSTLARWGMHPGPYLVIPILGPSTLRDGLGFFSDFGTTFLINVADLYRGNISWVLRPLEAVDVRSNTSFRYYATGSLFEYDTIRFLYVRKTLIEDEGLRLWHRTGTHDAQAPAGL
jgi:phospholipid-binding lipoprotein MlaA